MPSGGTPEHATDNAEKSRLRNVLKQALSRNKAHEKRDLWKQKKQEDCGSQFALTLKSNDGQVRSVALVPEGAQVSDNNVNLYEEERRRMSGKKEDKLLDRLCDGQDVAWRPDSFFEALGDQDVPWSMRPTDLFANRSMVERIVCAYEASRGLSKKEKKKKKDKQKDKKSKKKEKRKRSKHKEEKKAKKLKENKEKKKKKTKRHAAEETRQSDANSDECSSVVVVCESSPDALSEGSQDAPAEDSQASLAEGSQDSALAEGSQDSSGRWLPESSQDALASCASSSVDGFASNPSDV
mmetsp:Transcript_92581/g.145304  ORF Transcript_92581/g.145304 Transcript_92581/m.145304 type:complete len:296 (-) Transcript_92581:34-921(-)